MIKVKALILQFSKAFKNTKKSLLGYLQPNWQKGRKALFTNLKKTTDFVYTLS